MHVRSRSVSTHCESLSLPRTRDIDCIATTNSRQQQQHSASVLPADAETAEAAATVLCCTSTQLRNNTGVKHFPPGDFFFKPRTAKKNCERTCVASPTKKNLICRFSGEIHDWKHLLLSFFLRKMLRVSAVTPASRLLEKSTTLRSSIWCSHCSVAKRQQFSCPLGTATLSLKLENVVQGGWICFLSYCCGQVFF